MGLDSEISDIVDCKLIWIEEKIIEIQGKDTKKDSAYIKLTKAFESN